MRAPITTRIRHARDIAARIAAGAKPTSRGELELIADLLTALADHAERDAARKDAERYSAALGTIHGNATCTLDQYNRVGPSWTSESGEYYDASYVVESAEETIRIIDAARAAEGGTTT